MTDETPDKPEACRTGSGFYMPGTHEVACDEDDHSHLDQCAHCGATLSPNSEFCQVCAVAVSGGDADAVKPADTPAPAGGATETD